jgi:predicted N-formylglutamate amidohydrolase
MAKLTRPVESTMRREGTDIEAPVFRLLRPEGDSGLLLVCDHASNAIPAAFGTLGLSQADRAAHIAWDIGAAALTEALSQKLGAPALLANFSRLVADPNRGLDDPTLIVALSDGRFVPGNRNLTPAERAARIAHYYAPYHAAIDHAIARAQSAGVAPVLLAIHSFTPHWRGVARPWHLGVLWNKDARVVRPLLARLRAEGRYVVGDNEPYSGELTGDTLDRHATARGLAHALIEVRQDLIDKPAGVASLADPLAWIIHAALADAGFAKRAPGKEQTA